ncbi:MAG: S41 family peptidase [Patescibacteria group bacterium]
MKFTLPQIRRAAIYLSVLLLAFSFGWFARERYSSSGTLFKVAQKLNIDRVLPQKHKDVDFDLFWLVWDKLEADYYDKSKINETEMVLGAIKGMVSSIGDPYTSFLPPEEQKRTQEDLSGEFEGVGIEIGFRGSRLAVIAPLEGSPADRAGIKAGDYIIGIKDEKKEVETGTVGMSLIDAVESIRGKAGTNVTLILTREGEEKPLELEVTRAKIEVPSVVLTFQSTSVGEVAVLQLKRFGGNTKPEWDRAISQVQSKKPKGIVLDLRNNPGGYLPTSVDILSDFLDSGVAVIQQSGDTKRELSVSGRPRIPNTKMVVLVNAGSASASEIVAGALKDRNRAQIVGQKTFGKGTIQEARPVNGNSGLHITVAKWLTPNGTWVHENGLQPDLEVEDKADTEEDEQLSKALELLK